ncbi:hypothetical protein PC121_g14175 [Phytophthora cactorum]|nr:hypothetical protein PC121_g14175 [Phytophthora cactorum]
MNPSTSAADYTQWSNYTFWHEEEDGIFKLVESTNKYDSVFNMAQAAIYIDMNGRTTINFVGHQPLMLFKAVL